MMCCQRCAIARELSLGGAQLGESTNVPPPACNVDMKLRPSHAPDRGASLTRTAVVVGLHTARWMPNADGLLAPVDPAAADDQADRAWVYLASKFPDHADVRLLLSQSF